MHPDPLFLLSLFPGSIFRKSIQKEVVKAVMTNQPKNRPQQFSQQEEQTGRSPEIIQGKEGKHVIRLTGQHDTFSFGIYIKQGPQHQEQHVRHQE